MNKCDKCGKQIAGLGGFKTHVRYCGVFDVDKFWSRMVRLPWSGCWIWTGASNSWGYGTVNYYGGNKNASRVAWLVTHGEIPEGLDALHTCHVRLCCNPGHLYLGTDADNSRDKVLAGSYSRNVSIEQVREVRALLGTMPQVAIARRLGLTPSQVCGIKMGRNWAHIK